VNLVDAAILLALGLAAVTGYRRGAVLQICTYVGLLIGLLTGALLAPVLAGLLSSPLAQAMVALLVLLSLAAVGDGLGWLAGRTIRMAARTGPLAAADSMAGSMVSVAAGLLAVWFVALTLVSGPVPEVSRAIRGSAVIRTLAGTLPAPPAVLAQVRGFLNRFGFPEVFAGLPPAPAGPVRGPTGGQVQTAAEAADQSTLRIVGEACGRVQEGSGFLAAPQYVVTNAHVVAGVGSPAVQQQNGPSRRSVPVLFDPELDVAVLYLAEGPRDPLQMLGTEVDRGTGGAVLGYPAGGGLTFGPAAVRRTLSPLGRDIYGRSFVRREVYELQTVVRPGNSGGPFVVTNGRVAGVVFAASTTDPNVGYALTSDQVVPLLASVEDRTDAVWTGECIG
jgi:S1-C subfamily serine protease